MASSASQALRLLFVLLCTHLTRGAGVDVCKCTVLCASGLKHQLDSQGYYYSNGVCIKLTKNCSLSQKECVFESLSACQSSCKGRCGSYGCCPDGSPRLKDGHCAGDTSESAAAQPQVPDTSLTVRWDLVTVGVVVTVLVVAVVVVVGLAYFYRQKHKHRKRSRYIHEVLQMYDGSSDSLSDSSIDDNPESNNLFERL